MRLEEINNNSMEIKYHKTDNVFEDVCSIIESAKDYAYKSVNIALVERNWLIGYRIAEEELKGNDRADYGLEIIKKLSKELTKQYGKGFDARNLYYFLSFYKSFPNILNALSSKSKILLSWTHYRTLLQVFDKKARATKLVALVFHFLSISSIIKPIKFFKNRIESLQKCNL